MRDQRHLDVLDHGHRSGRRPDREGAPDAQPPDLAWLEPGEIFLLEPDLAGIRRKLAVDHVEAGGLAGAVRTDHGEELAALDLEAHAVDAAYAAERLGERTHRELAHTALRRAAIRPMAPTMPPGKTRTRSRMMPPSSARQYSVC